MQNIHDGSHSQSSYWDNHPTFGRITEPAYDLYRFSVNRREYISTNYSKIKDFMKTVFGIEREPVFVEKIEFPVRLQITNLWS